MYSRTMEHHLSSDQVYVRCKLQGTVVTEYICVLFSQVYE